MLKIVCAYPCIPQVIGGGGRFLPDGLDGRRVRIALPLAPVSVFTDRPTEMHMTNLPSALRAYLPVVVSRSELASDSPPLLLWVCMAAVSSALFAASKDLSEKGAA